MFFLLLSLFTLNTFAQRDYEKEMLSSVFRFTENIREMKDKEVVYFLGPNSYLDYEVATRRFPQKTKQIKVLNVTGLKEIGVSPPSKILSFFDRMFTGINLKEIEILTLKRRLLSAESMSVFMPNILNYLLIKKFNGKVKLDFKIDEDSFKYYNGQIDSLRQGYKAFNIVNLLTKVDSKLADKFYNTFLYFDTYPAQSLRKTTLSFDSYCENIKAKNKNIVLPKGMPVEVICRDFL